MNSNQLLQFRVVAMEENMHRAAEKLFVSPSALSHTIKQLEDELQCKLFVRNGRNIILTPDGKRLLSFCDDQNTLFDEIFHAFRDNVLKKPRVLCAASHLITALFGVHNYLGILDYTITTSNSAYPDDLSVLLKNGVSDVILDYGLFSYFDSLEIKREYLDKEMVSVLLPKNHPYFKKESLTLEELSDLGVLCAQNDYSWLKSFGSCYGIHIGVNTVLDDSLMGHILEQCDEPVVWPYLSSNNTVEMFCPEGKRIVPVTGLKSRKIYMYWLERNEDIARKLIEESKKR